MENKILSLDLGSNSIGATIRDFTDPENQFKKTTVITFETGVGKDEKGKYTLSHAAERTSKRSLRRLYQARKYKLWETLEVLSKNGYCPIKEESLKRWKHYDKEQAIKGNGGRAYPVDDTLFSNWIKLDFNNDGIPDYTSPYELRKELLTKIMDTSIQENRHKLGRALYHIAQHRGFKSSKKVQNADDEKDENEGEDYNKDKGAEGKKRTNFWKEIEKLGLGIDNSKTVGEVFGIIEKYNKENKTNFRIRKELHQYVTRKMLMTEVETIFNFQNISFESIFQNTKGEKIKISQSPMFWQRPLRSQKGTVGKCTLEPNKYRCPASHPAFEEFRALSFLNTIEYKIKHDKNSEWDQIPKEYRKDLYNEKFFRTSKDFDFFEIAEWIRKKNQHDKWELNYSNKTNVSACPVSANLKFIFGEDWQNYKLETSKIKEVKKKDGSIKKHEVSYNIDDIWHILFDSDDEDEIETFSTEVLKLGKKVNKFINLFKSMPVAYGMLSLKAITNILPFLREGHIYTEATLLAKVPKILGDDIWSKSEGHILSSLKKEVIDQNRIEKRILNITNNLIAQYKSLPANDKFAERNFDYIIGERDTLIDKNSEETDANKILKAIKESYGINTWGNKTQEEQAEINEKVKVAYQSFFSDKERKFNKLPHLQKSMKQFLSNNFDFLYCPNTFKEQNDNEEKCTCTKCKKLDSLYHPSQIDIYPPAKPNKDGRILLGSPITGAFKNPMALRALHELRKYVNYLITTNQIDEQTRIVVELAREHKLDDNNKRWAWDVYQTRRREENKEFRAAIYELLNDKHATGSIANLDSDSDIDKFRIWYEMIESEDAVMGFTDKQMKFVPLEKSIKIKKNRKGEDEEIEEFNNYDYLKINKSLYFKLQKAKDNVEAKYQLWKEQEYRCMYTGRIIRITDLFQENLIDFEHTIPRSKSFDNSLANLTVCYADYNRNIKRNQIPTQLPNYNEFSNGYDAIKPRLEIWEKKIADLKIHVNFWKAKSKRATTKDDKDAAIKQRHLWQFELNYWQDKVSRFTTEEIKGGFRKSQLVDTQIISKYALHYLKTVFNNVDVQKGAITAEFRKIFGIQEIGTSKDRTMHSHHAKDAVVLSLIPTPAIREQMLSVWYEIQEHKILLASDNEFNKATIQEHINLLEETLKQLKYQCKLLNVNETIDKVDEEILINNISKDQTLTKASRRIRSRGKIVPLKDDNKNIVYKTDSEGNRIQRVYKDKNPVWKTDENGEYKLDKNGDKIPVYEIQEKWARGDSIRGELHLATFYGKIKDVKRNDDGSILKDIDGKYQFDGFSCVLKKEVNKDLKVDKIVDPHLKATILKQLRGRTVGLTINEDGGFWMLKKDGSRAHKIRHIRCFADDVTNPIPVKKQTYLSNEEHKNFYWAKNGENIICALYQKTIKDKKGKDKIDREIEIVTLRDAAKLSSLGLVNKKIELYRKDKTGNIIFDENGSKEKPYAVLTPGLKVIFYEQHLAELIKEDDENEISYHQKISKAMYSIIKFKGSQVTFQHHLEARETKEIEIYYPQKKVYKLDTKGNEITFGGKGTDGFTESIFDVIKYNDGKPWPRLLYTKDWLNMAIEGKHFNIKPDGQIVWLF